MRSLTISAILALSVGLSGCELTRVATIPYVMAKNSVRQARRNAEERKEKKQAEDIEKSQKKLAEQFLTAYQAAPWSEWESVVFAQSIGNDSRVELRNKSVNTSESCTNTSFMFPVVVPTEDFLNLTAVVRPGFAQAFSTPYGVNTLNIACDPNQPIRIWQVVNRSGDPVRIGKPTDDLWEQTLVLPTAGTTLIASSSYSDRELIAPLSLGELAARTLDPADLTAPSPVNKNFRPLARRLKVANEYRGQTNKLSFYNLNSEPIVIEYVLYAKGASPPLDWTRSPSFGSISVLAGDWESVTANTEGKQMMSRIRQSLLQ